MSARKYLSRYKKKTKKEEEDKTRKTNWISKGLYR